MKNEENFQEESILIKKEFADFAKRQDDTLKILIAESQISVMSSYEKLHDEFFNDTIQEFLMNHNELEMKMKTKNFLDSVQEVSKAPMRSLQENQIIKEKKRLDANKMLTIIGDKYNVKPTLIPKDVELIKFVADIEVHYNNMLTNIIEEVKEVYNEMELEFDNINFDY